MRLPGIAQAAQRLGIDDALDRVEIDTARPLRTLVSLADAIRTAPVTDPAAEIADDAVRHAKRRGRVAGLAGAAGAAGDVLAGLTHEAWTGCRLSVAYDPAVTSERIAARWLTSWGWTESVDAAMALLDLPAAELTDDLVPRSRKPRELLDWLRTVRDVRERLTREGSRPGFLARAVPGLASVRLGRSAWEDMTEMVDVVGRDAGVTPPIAGLPG